MQSTMPAAAQGCLATSGRIVRWQVNGRENLVRIRLAPVTYGAYTWGCDHILSSGNDPDLLPAWLCRETAGREHTDFRARRKRGSGGGPRVPALPPVPGSWHDRVRGTGTRLPCRPADHRRRAGHRHRGIARGAAGGLTAAPAADLRRPSGRHPRPAGQVATRALRPAAA